ncbi:hypothetical protein [Winogradskyella sp. A2]|uniref:hypothetical protein n=1 Tax=Winogradskyella sp. A2 TaxID=3366944 RepID=UPI00398C4C13
MPKRILLVLLCSFAMISKSSSQQEPNNTRIYKWLDDNTGQMNSGLFNGLVYAEKHIMINEKHKFFGDFKFTKGTVVYNNEPYPNILIQYNVYQDQLLVRNSINTAEPIVLLYKEKVRRFTVSDHVFVNLTIDLEDDETIEGFFEYLLRRDSVSVIKKHQKKIRDRTNDRIRYHEFEDDSFYIVLLDSVYTRIREPKKLLRQFPEYKEIIKNIEEDYKDSNSSTNDNYIVAVFEAIAFQLEKGKE